MKVVELLKKNLRLSIEAKQTFLQAGTPLEAFGAAADAVIDTYRRGGRLYIAGNGGSAADAQHLAAEFVCKLGQPRNPLAAEALGADLATLTAIANDYAFADIFARQLQCKATPKDVFLALSTSGNSTNIVRALEVCRQLNIVSVFFGGRNGGAAKELADISVIVPGSDSARIQELHIVLYHTLVECVEAAVFLKRARQLSSSAPRPANH